MDGSWQSGMGYWQGAEPEVIERLPLSPSIRGYEVDYISSTELRLRRFYDTEMIITVPPIEEGTILRLAGGSVGATLFVDSIQVYPPLPRIIYWWKRFRRWMMRKRLRGKP
jgi:hypothetical protein